MNPIFTRRYKGSGRPNIMPTSKRQNYQKSMSTTSSNSSNSTFESRSSSVCEDDSPGHSEDLSKSPISEEPPTMLFQSKGSRKKNSGSVLAHQLLASKQNMLAQQNLTPQENRQRAKMSGSSGGGGGSSNQQPQFNSSMRQSVSIDNFGHVSPNSQSSGMTRSPTVHEIGGPGRSSQKTDDEFNEMRFCELEDIDDGDDDMQMPAAPSFNQYGNSRISRPNLNQRISKEALDMKTWRELKQVVSGNTSFHEGWIGQGFTFDHNIPFGLVQRKGGPCGVLAVVQSILLRNLLFGSPFSNEGHEMSKEMRSVLMGEGGTVNTENRIKQERNSYLVDAIAGIIWGCAQSRTFPKRTETSIIMFSDFRIQPEMINVTGQLELLNFLEDNLYRFDCVSLVYSAVLSRGISGVKDDMDFENCSLVGQHGYCSQELINLLNMGKAISNTFDYEIELDGKVLKGITSQCDIGLLSLFEHYDSIQVGKNLKCPRYPVWMICSESHFSVLFSYENSLCNENNQGAPSNFDLFYYDGLGRQDKIIRLSIDTSRHDMPANKFGIDKKQASFLDVRPSFSYGRDGNQQSYSSGGSSSMMAGEDLVPPLEKCIRTKWTGAVVDWIDTEPIL